MKFRFHSIFWIVIALCLAGGLKAEELTSDPSAADTIVRCSFASSELDARNQKEHKRVLISLASGCPKDYEAFASKIIDDGLLDKTAYRPENTHCNALNSIDGEYESYDFFQLLELVGKVDIRQPENTLQEAEEANQLGTELQRLNETKLGDNCFAVGAIESINLPVNSAQLNSWKSTGIVFLLTYAATGLKPVREPAQWVFDSIANFIPFSSPHRKYLAPSKRNVTPVSEPQAYFSAIVAVMYKLAPAIRERLTKRKEE